jgi:hypothetical protein
MELKHREEIKVIHEQMNQMMTMIQRNPKLANIKPEILIKSHPQVGSRRMITTKL